MSKGKKKKKREEKECVYAQLGSVFSHVLVCPKEKEKSVCARWGFLGSI